MVPEEAGDLERTARGLRSGDHHYRAYVGPPGRYDLVAAIQFNLLTMLGLREDHVLLDIGCGSLRCGRLLVPYLLPGRYFGIEPNTWLIDEAIRWELGEDLVRIKRPTFSDVSDFSLGVFGRPFDFLMAQSIFTHASKQQIRRCIAEAAKVMKPSSVFVANFLEGPEDHPGSEWVYPQNVAYTPGLIQDAAAEAGLGSRLIDWPHPTLRWVLMFHAGHEPRVPAVRSAPDIAALEAEVAALEAVVAALEAEVGAHRERVRRLEGHPYVRMGLWARRTWQRVRRSAP